MLRVRAALLAPYPYWPLVVAIGTGPTLLAGWISRDLLLPAGLAAILLQIFLFGRILIQVLPDRESSSWGIIKEYGASYLIASIVVAVLTFIMQKAVAAVAPSQLPYWLILGVVKGAVVAVTIYVWPLVFLQRSSISAILAGVTVFAGSVYSSLWIVGIALLGQAALLASQLVYYGDRSGFNFAILLMAGVVCTYLTASSFAAALHKILGARVSEAVEV